MLVSCTLIVNHKTGTVNNNIYKKTVIIHCLVITLFLQAAALVNTQDDNRIKLLYEFLADACEVYSEVFPLM